MFYNCINAMKLCFIYKKKGFTIKYTKNNLDLLKVLLKLNLIKFLKIQNKTIWVYVNYDDKGDLIFKNIINLFKPGHKMYFTLRNLKKISENYNWIIILSTSKGVLNNFEAIRENVGGIGIAKLWN